MKSSNEEQWGFHEISKYTPQYYLWLTYQIFIDSIKI